MILPSEELEELDDSGRLDSPGSAVVMKFVSESDSDSEEDDEVSA